MTSWAWPLSFTHLEGMSWNCRFPMSAVHVIAFLAFFVHGRALKRESVGAFWLPLEAKSLAFNFKDSSRSYGCLWDI